MKAAGLGSGSWEAGRHLVSDIRSLSSGSLPNYRFSHIVPGPVRPTAGPPVAIPFNPIIVEGDVNLRSRQELLDVIPQADHHSLVIHLPSKASSTKTGPKPRKIRVKSREYVADSSDEMMEEGDRSETGGERGRVMVRTDKGKGKEISEETRDSGIQEVVKEEPMDVDLVPKQLTEVPSGPSGPSRRTQMPKKSSMKPGKDTAPEVNIGNSEACEKCVKRGTSCVYGGRVACEACRAHKQKCTGVSKDWRKQVKAKMSSEDTRATTPALGKAPETSSSSTTPRRSSRARSVSRPAEPPTALHAPNRESTAKPQMTPKRNTTPKRSTTPKTTTPKPTQKTATTTKAKPQSKGRSTSRGRSKGKSRQVDNDDVSDEGETGRGSPAGVMVPELGQVPSRYMYLVKRDGEEVTGGVRVEEGGTTMRESDSGVLERLQRENEQLMKEMTAMREEMRKLKETVVGLEMRQSVLISHHNAHTSLLERHRQALTTLTSQPPTPSDRRTPVDDQGVHRLSMPPSRFGSITPTCNSAPYIRPPVPSPNPEYVDSMSPFSTPRTNRMFTEFVHPSMLQLNMLQISANESVAHGLQVAPDLPMEEDIPDAGPFPVATARDEEARAHGSGVVTKVSFEEDISEKVGSGEAGASGLGDKQKAMLPGMPISAMRMLSPTSQTDMNYDDPEDPCAMALDSPQEALQKGQGQLDRHWDTII
jgi:hypothetical protein